ncbi:MAG: SRPBCC domain-containing protein [Bdellovibrionales bacterium]|nr:SRPBCC domain-containing protein [Bdellovibrionales bacterium]
MNLSINRVFNGPCHLVFEAWTHPEIIKKWFSPSGEWIVHVESMAVHPGGQYSYVIASPDGEKKWPVSGEYKEVTKNEKLVFTWNTMDVKGTLVTVTFKDLGDKTEVILVHDILPNQEQVDEHKYGWEACMDQLSKKVLK